MSSMSSMMIAEPETIPAPRITSAVSGTVVDTAGTPWAFCVLQFSLFVPSGQKPIDLTTGLVIPNPAPVTADNLGRFIVNLQQNATVVPQSQWTVTVFPFISSIQGQQLTPFLVAGPVSLTAQIAAQLRPFDIGPPLILPTSHNGDIGRSNDTASVFYDVDTSSLFVRDPAADDYVKIGPGGAPPAQVFPGAGVAVSTGAAWAASLPPASLASYPAAGVPVSSGSAWSSSIPAASLAVYPGAGIPVSSGSAWTASVPAASIPPVYLDNTATKAAQPRIITGAGTLAGGLLTVTFAVPFLSGTFPTVLLSIIGTEAAGTTTVPVVWLWSVDNLGFTVHASSLTSTDTLRWTAIGTT